MVHQYIIFVSHKLRCYTSDIGPKIEVDTFNMRHENGKKNSKRTAHPKYKRCDYAMRIKMLSI
jgi:hypothetical protein